MYTQNAVPLAIIGGAVYLGLVYGWIGQRTGTLRYTILAHMLVNAMGLGFASLLRGG